MTKRFWIVLLAAGMLLGVAQAAQAALSLVGPTSPATGYFPVYYQDATGRQLELCLSQTVGPNGGMCVLLAAPGFDPALPIVFPVNFPDESFWFIADALIDDPASGVTLTYRAAVEAAFANGAVTNGDQISFARIRVRMNLSVPGPGQYTITHPYGVEGPFNVTGTGKVINVTRDIGVGAPGNFGGALDGNIGPFLTAKTGLITIGTERFIGDPNIPQEVTGGPNGNIVQVQRTGNGVPNLDLQTKQFFLAGKVWGGALPTNVSVERSTYSRSAAGSQIDVFATSTSTATLSFRDALVGGTSTPMTRDGSKFFGQLPAPRPAYVIVTATDAATPSTQLGSRVVDVVKITKALYALDTRKLLVQAASSDQAAPPLLRTAFGPLAVVGSGPTQELVVPLAQPPARVTVASSHGGADTEPVRIVSTLVSAAPVAADDSATTAQGVAVTIAVLANDTDADGNALTVANLSTPVNGTAVVQADNTVLYTPNATFSGIDTFTYQAQDSLGGLSNVATVTVTVTPAVNLAPIAQNDSATTTAGVAVAINLVGNDSDPDGTINASSVAIVPGSGPANGTALFNVPAAGLVTYTPSAGFSGTDSFKYTVADNGNPPARSNQATVTVQVNPANPAPIAVNDSATTVANTAVTVNVLTNDSDPAPPNLPLSVGSVGLAIAPTRGTAINNFNGTVTYRPNQCTVTPFQPFSDTFSYVAVDALGKPSSPATVTVTVIARAETLTATASARIRGAEWTVNGTTTVFPGNTITVYRLRTGVPNAQIGTAVPDTAGRWKLSVKNSPVVPAAGDRILVTSSFCNQRDFPVTVR